MPKAKKKIKVLGTIESDTPILPYVVAESVVREVVFHLAGLPVLNLPSMTQGERDVYTLELGARAEECYKANPSFAKKLQSKTDGGRDYLYMFMRHWLSAALHERRPEIFALLPEGFTMGREPAY